MAWERKLLESEATTGVFVLLGEQGNKAVLDWVMKEGLIPSKYESPKCKKDMRLVERKGTIDCFEWRCRVQSKENPELFPDKLKIKACRSKRWQKSSKTVDEKNSNSMVLQTPQIALWSRNASIVHSVIPLIRNYVPNGK
ncbi:hypothetical protein TNCV_2496081 [Trichonephila clavipes]|nr:hypothetical protein TNCV_2496081 [Trichonephila clavipes]